MLIALLVGLGAGFLIVFGLQLKLQRDLRVFLSDAHLGAMAEALAAVSPDSGERPTFGGVAFSTSHDDGEPVLWIRSTRKLPPASLSWVVAVASVIADVPPEARRTDTTHLRMPWTRTVGTPELSALRATAADRLGATRINAA